MGRRNVCAQSFSRRGGRYVALRAPHGSRQTSLLRPHASRRPCRRESLDVRIQRLMERTTSTGSAMVVSHVAKLSGEAPWIDDGLP